MCRVGWKKCSTKRSQQVDVVTSSLYVVEMPPAAVKAPGPGNGVLGISERVGGFPALYQGL